MSLFVHLQCNTSTRFIHKTYLHTFFIDTNVKPLKRTVKLTHLRHSLRQGLEMIRKQDFLMIHSNHPTKLRTSKGIELKTINRKLNSPLIDSLQITTHAKIIIIINFFFFL